MEEDTYPTSVDIEVKLPNKIDVTVDADEREVPINGHSHRQRKEGSKEEYEEETAFDGEFIKVEKESIDAKESSQSHKPISEVEETSCVTNIYSSNQVPDIDFSELDEKIKTLELQIENVANELQQSESEKALLKSEVDLAKGKLEKMDRYCEELALDRNKMKEQILEAEQKNKLHLQSLEKALGALSVKHKELVDAKEAFNEFSTELESSRKKVEDLEIQVVLSAGEAHKFEELSNERSSHAEVEFQKAEIENTLKVREFRAKEMEDQQSNLQEELKELHNKIAENQQLEEALRNTTLDLSVVREKLDLSKSQVADLEQKLVSQEDNIQELIQELNLKKASEEQMRKDVYALENLLSASREDLQAKVANLEEVELKLQEEREAREIVEASLEEQENKTLNLLEESEKLTGENETLQSTVVDLNTYLAQTKELCSQLEAKLNLADQNFGRTDSLLSQALSHNEELDQKLKSLGELHHEYRTVAETTSQRNLELEGLVQASNAAEEGVKVQLRESEMRLISAEKRNMELEQQLMLLEIKCVDADREIKELNEKTEELTTLLRGSEEESALSNCRFQAYEDRIIQLESSLSNSYSMNSQLEQGLKGLAEKCTEHEGRASATHQRSLELEGLVHMSHSKAEDAGKKLRELELLLEAASYRNRELEQLLSNTEAKYRDADAESKQYNSRISELSAELEAFQIKSASLEAVLQAASEKERGLIDMLNICTEERKKFEVMSNSYGEKLLQAENLVEFLQHELHSVREKLESVETDLEASNIRENEMLEKLKSAVEQLEHQLREVEQANSRSLELEMLHESLVKDSELKFHEAAVSFSQKDSEAKQLHEKLKSLEEQMASHQDQAIEATEKVTSLKAELEASAIQLVALENTIEELKRKISETEAKLEQSISDNELLAGTNSKLQEELVAHQCKVSELHELLSTTHSEKEATAEQLASHADTISKLTDVHTRGLEIQSATETRFKETEAQLHESIERFAQRDSEARDLNEQLLALQVQLKVSEEQVSEATSVAESRKVELEETLHKLQKLEGFVEEIQSKASQFETENEGLARENLSLSQELAAWETKMNESQMALNAVIAEKEATSAQLHASRKTIEDLVRQLASDGEKLQSQISSVMEENNMLNQMHQDTKKELLAVKAQMEERINELKAREISLIADMEYLKGELSEKSHVQAQILELEQQLVLTKNKYKEEIDYMQKTDAEKETILASKLEEHASILHERDVLDEQLKELQKELKLVHSTLTEQKELDSRKELEREATMNQSLGEAEVVQKHAALLETQVEELKQKLEIAEEQYKEKDKKLALVNTYLDDLKLKLSQIDELEKKIIELENKLQLLNAKSGEQAKDGIIEAKPKDSVEVKSRDFGLDTSSVPKRKSKKRSEKAQQTTEATTTAAAVEPKGVMAFKFILGVALVSVIIGVFLGKRF